MSDEKSITIKKDTLWKGAAVIFGVLFLIAIFGGFSFGGGSGSSGGGGTATDIGASGLSVQSLKVYADELGLNKGDFNDCLDSGKYTSEVNKETSQATAAGGRGTPYFVIVNNNNGNTAAVSGAVPWSNIEAAISAVSSISENLVVQIEDNDPILGDANAGISIVEFSDFQCPFCGRVHTDALADFKQSSYFTNGEVNLVYKQFPLSSIHPFAQKAGEASLCAHDQGMFWEYHDTLFANQ